MKRAANIFAARSAQEAYDLVRAAGVTHLIFLSWDDFNEPYVRLARGLSAREPLKENAFVNELVRARLPPPWLQQIPAHLPEHAFFRDKRILVYEVTNRTRPEQVLVRAINHLLYTGQVPTAAALRPELERFADDLASQAALARIHVELGDEDNFSRTMERVDQLLDQMPTLEPEDRVNVVTLYAISDHTSDARTLLIDAVAAFDEPALRHLTPGLLMNLLSLSDQLAVKWPDAALHDLAQRLVPPDGRP
jgi:hypothetical protein